MIDNKKDNNIQNLELWTKWHPYGQRVSDVVKFSIKFLKTYAPETLKKNKQ